jgi:hypothetical protein
MVGSQLGLPITSFQGGNRGGGDREGRSQAESREVKGVLRFVKRNSSDKGRHTAETLWWPRNSNDLPEQT